MSQFKQPVTCSDWYVYLIRTRLNALYCGITTDVERRYSQHQLGTGAKALKGKGPLTLEWSAKVGQSRSFASKIECRVKKLTKSQKEQLISGSSNLTDFFDIDLLN
ncbi:GIY-YIG nuclease family protein [Vibrio neptunius]|uniref:GIY-YIG nuclease family protein n=1 Tax=Vibrio neptunius TaxID=170651 RepID=UPI0019D187A2|nr:GIY-YIG nuclease family protein [Vibrio neptunius]MBN3572148.1 GIY-YIG nuclease family protein [Vibrio neptunius]QXX08639.1 GIY-YIG nuclease family protein [Vibrio neptunius]